MAISWSTVAIFADAFRIEYQGGRAEASGRGPPWMQSQ